MADKEKAQVFAAVFNRPLQFLGIEGTDETRVYSGRVEDVPAAIAESKAFSLYKDEGTVVVVGDLVDAEESEEDETDPDLQGNVGEVLKGAEGLSKDQLIDLKTRESAQRNRKGVLDGIDKLIAAKG